MTLPWINRTCTLQIVETSSLSLKGHTDQELGVLLQELLITGT